MVGTTQLMPTGIPGRRYGSFAGKTNPNQIPAVIYDGVQGYMLHTGGPTGAADGAAFSFAWAGTFNSDGSAMTLIDIPGTVPLKATRQSDNTIDFVGGTAGAVFSNSTAAVAASVGFCIVLGSCNGTASHLYVVHAAGLITGTNTPGSATNLDLTADWFLGADGGAAEFLDADTALWWIDDAFIDFSDSDNREEFWDTTNDLLRDPGATGTNPTGSQPLVCHKNSIAAGHAVNAGSGGDADTISGLLTDGTSPGTYAADFVPGTFPQTAAPTETQAATFLETNVVNMPATVNSGDLLLVFMTRAKDTGVTGFAEGTADAGWVNKAGNTGTADPGMRVDCWAKLADGSEAGGTASFTTEISGDAGTCMTAHCYRVTVWFGDLAGVEGANVAAAIATTADPPSLTPSWGSAKTLWFAVAGGGDDDATVSIYPTNYTNGVDTVSGGGTNAGCEIGTARRELEATSDDPGTFTFSQSEQVVALTVAVRPAA